MKHTRAAVIGYGNIGKRVVEALETAPDFEIAGIVRRVATGTTAELAGYRVVNNIATLSEVDVAVICSPSRMVEETAARILALGINTVDSFDIHPEIADVRTRLDEVARTHGAVAVVSAGWDPGSDSVVRTLLEACAPGGTTRTTFGPGMSMGHSVAARAVAGVRDALSMTLPAGEGVHRRHVYVELAEGADFGTVAGAVKADPYFVNDATEVEQAGNVAALVNTAHGVKITRDGVSGRTVGQRFEFSMRIDNPSLTAQILVSAARAAVRMQARNQPGAYTMIEIPPIDYLPGGREEIIRRLV